MKKSHWFLLALIIVIAIIYFVFQRARQKNQEREEELRQAQLKGLSITQPPRGQGLATILGAIFPFLL